MNPFKKLIHNFIYCGITGWCIEIIYTALLSLRRRERKLQGTTSIWMFPIYGCAAFLAPVMKLLQSRPFWVRGLSYMTLIFSAEYATGSLLSRHGLCPWDYGRSRFHINRVVRLDFAPNWFGAGLLFEYLLRRKDRT